MRRLVLLPLLALLWTQSGTAQPYLVKDINPSFDERSSEPDRFAHFGRYAIFAASTLFEGMELWSSNGSPAGTFLLADACPGECSSNPVPVVTTPRGVFFTTDIATAPGISRKELWITRGTPGTTFLLAEGVEARAGRTTLWSESQGVLYFSGADSAHGQELWRSDGTPAGTHLVKDVWPGPSGVVRELEIYRGRVFFGASDGVAGWALWASDGTAAGTALVKDPSPSTQLEEPGLRFVRATTGYLYFEAAGPAGRELWRSDGTTTGSRQVADLTPGPASTRITDAVAFGSRLLLQAEAGNQGEEVWVSDGSARGTRPLTHFAEGRPFSGAFSPGRSLSIALAIGNRLVFPVLETGLGRELWITDGTAAGTHLLADICAGACSAVTSLWPAVVFQNRIYFGASDAEHLGELWITDGTAAGTRLVRDIKPGEGSSFPADFFAVGGSVLFTAQDPAGNFRQIWKTNGTAAGTVRVSGFPTYNFIPQGLQGTTTPGRLFFAADDGVHGKELWMTNGTAAGTRLVANLDGVDHGGSKPQNLMTAGGTLYFFADDGVHGPELWKSDGTDAGTELVHEFLPGPGALAQPIVNLPADLGGTLVFMGSLGLSTAFYRTDGTDAGTYALTPENVRVADISENLVLPVAGGKAFFKAGRLESGDELWVTDGTLAGTRELDLLPGGSGSDPYAAVPFGDRIVFTARTSIFGDRRFWISDGTDAGTAPISDAVEPSSSPAVHQGLVYFLGREANTVQPSQLWRSDGTPAGTVKLPDLVPGRALQAQQLTSLGSRLLLWDAFGGTPNAGLWATDGTPAGTRRLSAVSRLFTVPRTLELGGVAYFAGTDGHDELLWRTDGTEAGTYPVRDRDGHTVAKPDVLAVFDGRLYFITSDVGATLWQSDSTPQGTFSLRQLEPGEHTSLALAVAGSRLFFRAFDPATGSELWAIGGR